jgi:hypothetical protein
MRRGDRLAGGAGRASPEGAEEDSPGRSHLGAVPRPALGRHAGTTSTFAHLCKMVLPRMISAASSGEAPAPPR